MSGAFKSGVIDGLMGFIMSALANYYLLPMADRPGICLRPSAHEPAAKGAKGANTTW